MTKQEILEYFKDINHAYNESTRFDDLSHMLDELMQSNSDGDSISRKSAILEIQRHGVGCFDADEFNPEQAERFVISRLNALPSIQPKTDVLGKIRADVINIADNRRSIPVRSVIKIIDKYKKYKTEEE